MHTGFNLYLVYVIGTPHRWLTPDEEEGQGRALRLQDPSGIPLEFYARMAPAERMLQRFDWSVAMSQVAEALRGGGENVEISPYTDRQGQVVFYTIRFPAD